MTDIPASTTKRLLRELKEYSKSPNDALLSLAPVSDDDLLHWEAVLKGVPDSPYEDHLRNAHLPSQHLLLDRRDLPDAAHVGALVARLHHLQHPVGDTPAADRPQPGLAAQRRRRGPVARRGPAGLDPAGEVLDGHGEVEQRPTATVESSSVKSLSAVSLVINVLAAPAAPWAPPAGQAEKREDKDRLSLLDWLLEAISTLV
ncbi:hypothetical protein TRV_07761 [Trichophyton verrucosum HKI 0517]|uniref:Uncharacterized protein n=1 Tax=Trichophyton verrucosum (strain HKI 0517) TaxID=663202 RepID=D4DKN9_TRIVH|nr:uncharacterized protein TRV_07761 [Trichophyton verrucosum HKI 0517]EFE37583.1 hypothetical protein TRV_07761 [Trichophyton verrucosum HKI 0517]